MKKLLSAFHKKSKFSIHTLLIVFFTISVFQIASSEIFAAKKIAGELSTLAYFDEIFKKIRPSLQRGLKKNNISGGIALTGISSTGRNLLHQEANYITSYFTSLQFKGSSGRFIKSVRGFNRWSFDENEDLRAYFQASQELRLELASELAVPYYAYVLVDFNNTKISLTLVISERASSDSLWTETFSVFFRERQIFGEFGFIQAVNYEYTTYLSNLIGTYVANYFDVGIFIDIGFSLVNTRQPNNGKFVNQLKASFLVGTRFNISLVRSIQKNYSGFDMLLVFRLGLRFDFLVSATYPVNPDTIFVNTAIAALGISFLIKESFYLFVDVDFIPLAEGGGFKSLSPYLGLLYRY